MLNLNDFFQKLTTTTVDFLQRLLPLIPVFIILLIVGIVFVKIASWSIKKALKISRLSLGLVEILSPIVDFVLWASLAILILHLMGFSGLIIALGGSLAVVAFGMSRGASSTVSDLLSGIFLARDKNFGVGESVRVLIGEKRKIEGKVVEMDTRKTRIIDSENHVHILPNSLIDHNEWVLVKHKQETKKSGTIKDTIISKIRKNK